MRETMESGTVGAAPTGEVGVYGGVVGVEDNARVWWEG